VFENANTVSAVVVTRTVDNRIPYFRVRSGLCSFRANSDPKPAEIRLDGLLQLLVCMPLVIPELRELIADLLSQAGELLL
jgi:hypothetical protein